MSVSVILQRCLAEWTAEAPYASWVGSGLYHAHSARRVKCDQSRPICANCVATKRKCEGFRDPPKVPAKNIEALLTTTSYHIPFRIPGSQRDRQLLHYFCVSGVVAISGTCSTDFWSSVVLQVSQDDYNVRQALLALSSLHLRLASANDPHVVVDEETLSRYGKAMRSLQRRINQSKDGDPKAAGCALICSVLFYCFECILGNTHLAIKHLDSGLHLLGSRLGSPQEGDAYGLSEFVPSVAATMGRLDMQASFFNDNRIPRLSLISAEERAGSVQHDPDYAFSSITEAHSELIKLENWIFHLLRENPETPGDMNAPIPSPEAVQEKSRLLVALDAWEQRLNGLVADETVARPPATDKSVDLSAASQPLLLQKRTLRMILLSRLPLDGTVFGAVPNPAAMDILRQAEELMQLFEASRTERDERHNTFSSEMGFIAPAFFLAIKCGDEAVREGAVALLKTSHKSQEGPFDAKIMLKVVEGIEEVAENRKLALKENGVEAPKNVSLEWWTIEALSAGTEFGSIDVLQDFIGSLPG